MEDRRKFLKKTLMFFSATGILFTPLSSFIQLIYAGAKKIVLPRGTKMETLIQKNPSSLDTRLLEVTPLKNFETMGLDDHEIQVAQWRLSVEGKVKTPLKLTYDEIKNLPSIQRKVLLICPGFFALNGHWKGISMEKLLQKAGIDSGATHLTFAGPEGTYEKVERFPMTDVRSGKIFLAYEVNGKTVPRKHGFPLRVVTEDYYGSYWVKYVYKVTVDHIS